LVEDGVGRHPRVVKVLEMIEHPDLHGHLDREACCHDVKMCQVLLAPP
jgi:hypothetical protein